MGYVIAAIIVLLLVAGFVTYLVLNSMRKSGSAARDGGAPGVGRDRTPLGDTTEHAGAQTERGTTASDPEGNAGEDEAARGLDPEGGEESARAADPPRPARGEERQRRDAGASAPESPVRQV